MPNTYPPAPPTISGDNLTVSRFLKDTPLVARALRTLEQQMFVSDKVFTGQLFTESGAVEYEQDETIFADRSPQAVGPGDEYPLTPISDGPAQVANTVKWGQDAEITDEAVSRKRFDPVRKAFRKLVNSSVLKIDGIALAAAVSAVTQNTAAIQPWDDSGTTPNILRDVMLAITNLLKLKQGYMPDTVFVDMDTFAYVASNDKLIQMIAREYPGVQDAPVLAGINSPYIRRTGGITWVTSPVAPISGVATVLDSSVFGAFVDEELPAPGYVRTEGMTQVKTIRDDDNDRWRVRARRITVPVVLEPNSAWKITGVNP